MDPISNISCSSSLSEFDTDRNHVLNTLQGSIVEVPDLFATYKGLKPELNPEYERVREELEEWLLKYAHYLITVPIE